MNKYIKKCLVIYSALALILVGMVGVTYAITATDADQYVTRSQYAVDMAHLQNKLDEQEAGLPDEREGRETRCSIRSALCCHHYCFQCRRMGTRSDRNG